MKKRQLPGWIIAAVCLLFAVSCSAEPKDRFFELEDKVSTAFFDYRVEDVSVYQHYNGMDARQGQQIVVVDLAIKNKENYTLPMGRYDFRIQWGLEGELFAYPEACQCREQLPDEYEIPEKDSVEGKLVFQVPQEQKNLCLAYLEIFENDEQGDAYFTCFTLGAAPKSGSLQG